MSKSLTAIIVAIASIALLTGCDSNQSNGEEKAAADKPAAAEKSEKSESESSDKSNEGESEAEEAEPKQDQSFSGMSEQGKFWVEITPEPNPIPFQELFVLDVRVLDPEDKKTPVENVEIDQVRATMPAHKHGMKVEPKVAKQEAGVFVVEGMKFHMQGPGKHGRWVIEAVLNDGSTVDKVSYDVQCCAEE
jgi:flagellum-specific peptidoglycan hydrolase FlgJ